MWETASNAQTTMLALVPNRRTPEFRRNSTPDTACTACTLPGAFAGRSQLDDTSLGPRQPRGQREARAIVPRLPCGGRAWGCVGFGGGGGFAACVASAGVPVLRWAVGSPGRVGAVARVRRFRPGSFFRDQLLYRFLPWYPDMFFFRRHVRRAQYSTLQ